MEERSDRFTAIEDQYAGYTVYDPDGDKIGKVDDPQQARENTHGRGAQRRVRQRLAFLTGVEGRGGVHVGF